MKLVSSQNLVLEIQSSYWQVKHWFLTHWYSKRSSVLMEILFHGVFNLWLVVTDKHRSQLWQDIHYSSENAPLKEEVYMVPPAGLLKLGQEWLVFKLKKALYSLKQAGCKWQKTLTTVMTNNLGFKHSVYFRHSVDEHMIIAVATDDMATTSKQLLDVIKFKSKIRLLCFD